MGFAIRCGAATAILILSLSHSYPLCASSALDHTVVFWKSEPVWPGQTVLLYGDGLSSSDEIAVLRLDDIKTGGPANFDTLSRSHAVSCKPVQPCNESTKFELPGGLDKGIYAAWIHTGAGWSAPIRLDAPEVWWAQGNLGVDASPGGWIRLMGTNLGSNGGSGRTPLVALISSTKPKDARRFEITGTVLDNYAVETRLPSNIPPGRYELALSNGYGGDLGWSNAVPFLVVQPILKRDATYNVREFGATGDGATDDTKSVLSAVGRAAQEGGGTVYFPSGRYKLSTTIDIPRKITLKGEQESRTSIFWANSKEPLPAILRGKSDFGIEDLTLVFSSAIHGIVADDDGSDSTGNVTLRAVRIRWNLYSGNITTQEAADRVQQSRRQPGGAGDLLRLTGKNIQIINCDLLSSGKALNLNSVDGAVVSNNIFENGRFGWYTLSGCQHVIFEHNLVAGADLMASGGGVNTLGHSLSRCVYFAHNELREFYGWDQEAMTLDGSGGAYFGSVQSSSGSKVITPTAELPGNGGLAGMVCYVISGKGKGQYRVITSNDEHSFDTETPWQVPLDTSSKVGITQMRGRYLFIGNKVTDAGVAIQLYGIALDVIVDSNSSTRAGGFRGYAIPYRASSNQDWAIANQPEMFVQFLNNEIVEGNTYIRGAMTASRIGLDSIPPSPDWASPMALGLIIRGNKLDSASQIVVSTKTSKVPAVEDVVIEGNTVKDSALDIRVESGAVRVVVNRNASLQSRKPLD